MFADEKSFKRWDHFWNGAVYDRPVMQITAPLRQFESEYIKKANDDPTAKWADTDNIFAVNQYILDNTLFLAEATHVIYPDWAAGSACFYGCKPIFRDESVWADPLPVGEGELPVFKFDENSKYLQWMFDFYTYCKERYDGRFFLSSYVNISAADTLLVIRGVGELMMDIVERPEWVKASVNKIFQDLCFLYSRLDKIIGDDMGYSTIYGQYSNKPVAMGDCDVSYMISPKQFDEIFLDQLIEQLSAKPHSFYHMDGTQTHIDTLLAIEQLNCIQWEAGAGREEIMQWAPLIRKIQRAKKGAIIKCKPKEVASLLDEIGPEGICIRVACSCEDEARSLLSYVDKKYGIS